MEPLKSGASAADMQFVPARHRFEQNTRKALDVNWKLIFQLSLFGLFMGVATVFFIPSSVEPICWLGIFVVCAYLIARRAAPPFLSGVCLGMANSVWVTVAHILFVDQYIAGHPKEAAMMTSMPIASHPRLLMALTGPLVGLGSGLVLGLFALIAARFVKKSRAG